MSLDSPPARLAKIFDQMIFHEMTINGSPSYLDDVTKPVFSCNMRNCAILPSKEEFFKKKIGQFTTFYKFHRDVATSHSVITRDLLNKSLDTQLNVTAMNVEQFLK